jgi:hypothetical protein
MPADWSNRYLREIVVKWFDRSQDHGDWKNVFDRFIFLWIAFDAWGSNESKAINDKMIDWAKTSPLKDVFRQIRPNLEDDLRRLHEKGEIPNHMGGPSIWLEDPHDFHRLLDVIYQIRNNLFHGHKSPDDVGDEELVTLAYRILSPIFKPSVENLRGS